MELLRRELTVGPIVDVINAASRSLHSGEDSDKVLLCLFQVPAMFLASTNCCIGLEAGVSGFDVVLAVTITHFYSFLASTTLIALQHWCSYPYHPVPIVH
jgi:hypothetical protein